MADFNKQIPLIKIAEGGKSKDPNDDAAAYPVPDGSGYHTNRGITWHTFSFLLPKMGITPTPALFYAMPDDIWLKIYKVGFWNSINGDAIKSQAIAGLLVEAAWGSGPGIAGVMLQKVLNTKGYALSVDGGIGAKTIAALNTETAKNEKGLYDALYQARMTFLKSLPDWQHYSVGWSDRMSKVYSQGISWITTNPVKSGGGVFFLGATITAIIYRKQIAKFLNPN